MCVLRAGVSPRGSCWTQFSQGRLALKLQLTESAQTAGTTATGQRNRGEREWEGSGREREGKKDRDEERVGDTERARVRERASKRSHGSPSHVHEACSTPFTGPALTAQDLPSSQ